MLLLSGCFLQQDIKSRECPGFNQPLAKQWQPIESGNSLVLTNTNGDSAVYLVSVTSSEPYVAAIDVNGSALDTPVCTMTSTHVFSAEDGSHDFFWHFFQRDDDGGNPANDFLTMAIEVSLPSSESGVAGRVFSSTMGVSLSALPTNSEGDELAPVFLSEQLLENGQSYTDIIKFPSFSVPPEPEFEQYLISEILLSRTVGLIQFSRNDGTVYTVVPE